VKKQFLVAAGMVQMVQLLAAGSADGTAVRYE